MSALVGGMTKTPRRDAVISLSLRWRKAQRAKELEVKARRTKTHLELAAAVSPVGIPILPWSSPSKIVDQVAFWTGVPAAEILGTSRIARFIEARFDAIAAVWINCRIDNRQLSLPEVGRYFSRDHASILNALRQRGLK